jgi:hypothetical protein
MIARTASKIASWFAIGIAFLAIARLLDWVDAILTALPHAVNFPGAERYRVLTSHCCAGKMTSELAVRQP